MTKRRLETKAKPQQAAQEKKNPAEPALSAFSMWQAWAIAQAVFELAESLETVGAKNSTLNKIDILRRAISEVYNDLIVCEPAADGQSGIRPVKRKLSACESEMRDIFQAILEQVVSCYSSSEVKPMPSETAHKLRELSERLRHYAGDFKEHTPMEKLTDEMRALADDLKHTDQDGYPIMWIFERAARIKSMLLEIYCDVVYDTETGQRRIRQELIGDWSEMSAEEKVKKLGELRSEIFIDGEAETESYTFQAMLILDRIDPRKTWSEKDPGDLRYFADQLDKCPPVMQYRKFWNMLKSAKGEAYLVDAETTKQKIKAASGGDTSNTHTKSFRSVTWYGSTYTFNENQAIIVKLLWGAMERGESGIHQNTIAESLDTVSKTYRLLDTFRQHKKTHPAWSEMIHHLGHGVYTLNKPD